MNGKMAEEGFCEKEAEVRCGEGGGRGGKDGGGGVEKEKEVEDNLAEQEQVVSSQAAVFLAEEEVEEEGEEKGKKQGMVRGGRRERRERLRSLSNSHRLLIPYHTGERNFIYCLDSPRVAVRLVVLVVGASMCSTGSWRRRG